MSEAVATWRDCYSVLAELWCSPSEAEPEERRSRAEAMVPELEELDPHAAASLSTFLANPISEEEYVGLFELDPRCPLYLGSHSFDEPKTCAQAGTSDRNGYMIELLGIYRHHGLTPSAEELPDYLPLVLEFLGLTARSEDPVRQKLITEYVLPFLPPMRKRLEELGSPYTHLIDVTERVLNGDGRA